MRARSITLVAIVLACVIAAPGQATAQERRADSTASAAPQQELPDWIRRGLPGPAHEVLRALEGTWRVEKSLFIAVGSRDQPTVSDDLICRRELLADGRFLRDVTEGTLAGSPYWRLGLLGYSTMDERYEWVTADRFNANMMIYLGEPDSGRELPISMSGVFTDQGVVGEETVGRPVRQRTVIRIEDEDRHVIELYFTPPGGEEILADRSVYTRVEG